MTEVTPLQFIQRLEDDLEQWRREISPSTSPEEIKMLANCAETLKDIKDQHISRVKVFNEALARADQMISQLGELLKSLPDVGQIPDSLDQAEQLLSETERKIEQIEGLRQTIAEEDESIGFYWKQLIRDQVMLLRIEKAIMSHRSRFGKAE